MTTPLKPQSDFNEITQLIQAARQRAVQAVNTSLIELYWQVKQFISRKIAQAEWGDGVVAHNWTGICWKAASTSAPCESQVLRPR